MKNRCLWGGGKMWGNGAKIGGKMWGNVGDVGWNSFVLWVLFC